MLKNFFVVVEVDSGFLHRYRISVIENFDVGYTEFPRDFLSESSIICFVCHGKVPSKITNHYRRCSCCGHEILASQDDQGYIINEVLDEMEIQRTLRIDSFKIRTLSRFDREIPKKLLLDIGSGSGKFLYQAQKRYERVIGTEVTPESLAFSRDVLGLNVVETSAEIPNDVSMATAWHSVEHIPSASLITLLRSLSRKVSADGRVIISVPNGNSFQSKIFGRHSAYLDVPNHLHQFTPCSLQILMAKFGFKPIGVVSSFDYNLFGYVQSILNWITNTHNYLYYRLKRKTIVPVLSKDIANALALCLAVPCGLIFSIADCVFKNRQAVHTACFEKNDRN